MSGGPTHTRDSKILSFIPEVFRLHVAPSYVDFMECKKDFSSAQLNTLPFLISQYEDLLPSTEWWLFTLTTSAQVTFKTSHILNRITFVLNVLPVLIFFSLKNRIHLIHSREGMCHIWT